MLAALLLAVVVSISLSVDSQNQKREHTQEREAAAAYQTESARGEIEATCIQDARTRTYRCTADIPVPDQHDPYAEYDLRAQQDMARYAFAVAAISMGSLGVTTFALILLWWTLEATREAVAAATSANAGFAEHSQRELRAYVSVGSVDHEMIRTPSGTPIHMFLPIWENKGATPTRRCRMYSSWASFAPDMPAAFGFFDIYDDANQWDSTVVIGPGQSVKATGVLISPQFLTAAMQGTVRLYMWGWADYNDVFAGTKRHRTEFCCRIVVSPVDDAGNVRFTYANHDRHNAADEDCLREPLPA